MRRTVQQQVRWCPQGHQCIHPVGLLLTNRPKTTQPSAGTTSTPRWARPAARGVNRLAAHGVNPPARPARARSPGSRTNPTTGRQNIPRPGRCSPEKLPHSSSRPQSMSRTGQRRASPRYRRQRKEDARRLRRHGRNVPRATQPPRSHRPRRVERRRLAGRRLPPPTGRICRTRPRHGRRTARFPRKSARSSFPVTPYERRCPAILHRKARRRGGPCRAAHYDRVRSRPARRRAGRPRVDRNSLSPNRLGRGRRNGTGTKVVG